MYARFDRCNSKGCRVATGLTLFALVLLSCAFIALDYSMVKTTKLHYNESVMQCPPSLKGEFDEYLCQGVDFSNYQPNNTQGMPNGFPITVDLSAYNQDFDIDFVFVPKTSGKTTISIHADVMTSVDGISWNAFTNYKSNVTKTLVAGKEFKLSLVGKAPVRETYFLVNIVDAKSTNVQFSDVIMAASSHHEGFGFTQLWFKCVFCGSAFFVSLIAVISYLRRTKTEMPEIQKITVLVTAVLPFFISPVYIFTMWYPYSPMMVAQYLLKCIFLGLFEFYNMRLTVENLSKECFLHRMPVFLGLMTFLSTFINEFVGVTSIYEDFDYHTAKTGLAVISAVVLFVNMLFRFIAIIKMFMQKTSTSFGKFIAILPIWFELMLIMIMIDEICHVGYFGQGINCWDLNVVMTAWVTILCAWTVQPKVDEETK